MDKLLKYFSDSYPKDIISLVSQSKISFQENLVFNDSKLYKVDIYLENVYDIIVNFDIYNIDTGILDSANNSIDISSYEEIYIDSQGEPYESYPTLYSFSLFTDGAKIKFFVGLYFQYYSSNDSDTINDRFLILFECDLNGIYLNKIDYDYFNMSVKSFYPTTTTDGTEEFVKTSYYTIAKTNGTTFSEFVDLQNITGISHDIDYLIEGVLIYNDFLYAFTLDSNGYGGPKTYKFNKDTGDFIERYNYGFINAYTSRSDSMLNEGVMPVNGFQNLYAVVENTSGNGTEGYYNYTYDYNYLYPDNNMFLVGVTTGKLLIFSDENITIDNSTISENFYNLRCIYLFDGEYFSQYLTKEITSQYLNVYGDDQEGSIIVPPESCINYAKAIIGQQGLIPNTEENIFLTSDTYYSGNLSSINYNISTVNDLFNMRYDNRGQFVLSSDIDLLNFAIPSYHPAEAWCFTQNYEAGSFPSIVNFYDHLFTNDYDVSLNLDGQDYTINNYYSVNNTSGNDYICGLIGSIYDETYPDNGFPTGNEWTGVKNLKMKNVNVKADYNASAVVGFMMMNNDKKYFIKNVQVEGYVEGNSEAGGIAGYAGYFSYDNADEYYPETVTIEKCYFKGTINNGTNGSGAGGILGWGSAKIKNCYAIADVHCADSPGGICGGWEKAKTEDMIENCYFVGTISGASGAPIAVDWNLPESSVINCYYDSDVFEGTIYNVYSTPKTTEEMTYPYDEKTYINWIFSELPDPVDYDYPSTVDFQNDSIEEIMDKTNNGYPALGPGETIWFPLRPWIATGIGLVKFGGTFFWVKKNEAWNPATGYVKKNGSWHPIATADVKKGGSWG